MSGIAELKRRMSELDDPAGSGPADADPVREDIRRYVEVLETVTSTGDHTRASILAPAEADRVTASCRLLRRLDDAVPQIVSAPVDRLSQYWISTGNPPWVAPREPRLAELGRPQAPGEPDRIAEADLPGRRAGGRPVGLSRVPRNRRQR